VAATAVAFFVGGVALAQNPAPRDNPSVMVGGKKLSVEYGQPSLGERSFDELMKKLPADRMWRAGSEQVTTLETAGEVMIGGEPIAAGKYSLYVHCPEEGDYSLAINSVLGQPLGKIWAKAPPNLANEPWPHFKYTEEIGDKEVARVPMKKAALDAPVDPFTIKLDAKGDGAVMTMSWGDRSWSVGITPAK
jgi:hypothetical protein